MKKLRTTLFMFMLGLFPLSFVQAQSANTKLEIPIQATGGQIKDTLDDGSVVTLDLSSDDAEQENDAVDTPYDDDLDAGWEGAPEDQNTLSVGLRFQNIRIPKEAIIDSAYIIVYSHEGKTADDVAEINIIGEDTADAKTFDDDHFNDSYLLTDRIHTSSNVDWTVDEPWNIWEPYRTPDLKTIVQEIVNREDWNNGNAMAFFFLGENQGASIYENAREFEAFENISDPEDTDVDGNPGDGQNHPDRVPKLVVYYRVQAEIEIPIRATGGQIKDTLDDGSVVTLDLSSDDAEQENDAVDTPYDDDLDAGWEGAPEDQNVLHLGLRFTQIPVPQGSVIDSAFIKMWSHEGKTADDVANITIAAEDTSDAKTFNDAHFNDSYLLTDRNHTQASVLWTVDESWEIWQPYKTPDIKDVVQEVVDRDDWTEGNAMAFFLLGENQGASTYENAREFEAFENISDPEDTDVDGNSGDGQNHPERVPRLFIYYTGPDTELSIQENMVSVEIKRNMVVYPNPLTNGLLNVKIETLDLIPANAYLYDITGSMVKSWRSKGPNEFSLNLSSFNDGLYILRVEQNEKVFMQKILIK